MGEKSIPTVEEFENMDIHLRADLLGQHGTLFDQKGEYGQKIWMYYLFGGRVVEVEYDPKKIIVWDVNVFKPFHPKNLARLEQQ